MFIDKFSPEFVGPLRTSDLMPRRGSEKFVGPSEPHTLICRGHLEAVTTVPAAKDDISIASIGGFSVKVGGRTIYFDWEEYCISLYNNDDGTVKMECTLKNFDDDYGKDGWVEEGYLVHEITPELLISGDIEEIFYELAADEDKPNIPIKFTYFMITGYKNEDDDDVTEYEFSEEQLDKYNNSLDMAELVYETNIN